MDIDVFIKKIEQEFDDIPPGTLNQDSAFKEALNWNSINSVVLSVMIEFEYKIMMSSDDFKRLTSIKQLADFIEQKMYE